MQLTDTLEITGLYSVIYTESTAAGDAGDMSVRAADLVVRSGGQIGSENKAGGSGGDVIVDAGSILVSKDGSADVTGILADTMGAGKGGMLTVKADNIIVQDGAEIRASIWGAGDGGGLLVEADSIVLARGGAPTPTGIFGQASTGNTAKNGSSVTVQAGTLEVLDGAKISTTTFGTADAGNLLVDAPLIFLSGSFEDDAGNLAQSGLFSVADRGSGNAGNLTVNAAEVLDIRNGAVVSNGTFTSGSGGDLLVNAGRVFISGEGASTLTGVSVSAETGSSGNAGTLIIQADSLEVRQGAQVLAATFGEGRGGDLKVASRNVLLVGDGVTWPTGLFTNAESGSGGDAGTLRVTGENIVVRDGARIAADTYGDGAAGDILIEAGEVFLSGDGNPLVTGVLSEASAGTGNAGKISVTANRLEIRDGAKIRADTFSVGRGGDVEVEADQILLSGDRSPYTTDISASAQKGSQANGGDVTVRAGTLEILDGATITADTSSTGRGGNILVVTDRLRMSGEDSPYSTGVFSEALPGSTGDAGNITLQSRNLEMKNGAQIGARTFDAGQGGNLTVKADSVVLSGGGNLKSTVISAGTTGGGHAGDVMVQANTLELRNAAAITTETRGPGNGGNTRILAKERVTLRDNASISSLSTGTGEAGAIYIDAGKVFESFNSSVTTEAELADGGNIKLKASDLIYLVDSEVTATVKSGEGSGGNIDIDPEFVILDGSKIIANAFGGPGGNITIVTDFFLVSPDSSVTASSALGIDGRVDIEAPDTDISGGIAVLPETFLDVSGLLRGRCGAARAGGAASSLVFAGRGGIPPEPDDYLPSFGVGPIDDGKMTAEMGVPDEYGSGIGGLAFGMPPPPCDPYPHL